MALMEVGDVVQLSVKGEKKIGLHQYSGAPATIKNIQGVINWWGDDRKYQIEFEDGMKIYGFKRHDLKYFKQIKPIEEWL